MHQDSRTKGCVREVSITCPLTRPLQQFDREFPKYLRRSGVTTRALRQSQLHLHHVWPGNRVNVPSNLIYISSFVHDYLHHIGGPPLRVAGIWGRFNRPGFSWEELDFAAGCNVRGWLQMDKCEWLPRPYCDWRRELIGGH